MRPSSAARPATGSLTGRSRTSTQVVTGCRERLKLIAAVDAKTLTPEQRDRLDYFKGLEEFIIAFFQTQELFQQARRRR